MADGMHDVAVSGGNGKERLRPGSLMIVNGGRLGSYRLVVKANLVLLGSFVRWDVAVLAGVGMICPALQAWVEEQRRRWGFYSGRLMGAAHLFMLGRFVATTDGYGYDVGSEFEEGAWYLVRFGARSENRSCTCPDYERNRMELGMAAAFVVGRFSCKHILAIRMWKLYELGERGNWNGMAGDCEPSDGDGAAD